MNNTNVKNNIAKNSKVKNDISKNMSFKTSCARNSRFKNIRLCSFCLLLFFLLSTVQPALGKNVPKLEDWANDFTDTLTSSQLETLDDILSDVEERKSSQVLLVIIESLEGEGLSDFAKRIVYSQIGASKQSKSVVILVAMKEKKIRIEVGRGMQHTVTPRKASYIIKNLMVPGFKNNHVFGGLRNGVNAVTGLITKEFDISPSELAKSESEYGHVSTVIAIGIALLMLFFGKGGTNRRRYRRDGYMDRSSSTFGGGSFGGGGASGGW
ncbi:MAG: TPM domain-containing protein [bacterium]|nr:TPM domain-containing protein [bacterium]